MYSCCFICIHILISLENDKQNITVSHRVEFEEIWNIKFKVSCCLNRIWVNTFIYDILNNAKGVEVCKGYIEKRWGYKGKVM